MSLIIQNDFTAILHTTDSSFKEIRNEMILFSSIKLTSDKMYIFEISSLSIWNAIAVGIAKDFIVTVLRKYSSKVPEKMIQMLDVWFARYGAVELHAHGDQIILKSISDEIRIIIRSNKKLSGLLIEETSEGFIFKKHNRGEIKSILVQNDLFVNDLIGYVLGDVLNFSMRPEITVKSYQEDAAQLSFNSGNATAIGPCGSGKTVIGIREMELCQTHTIIATNSQESVRQWKKALLKFTNLTEDQIGTYDQHNKEIKPVTITTYNMLAYKNKGEFVHFAKFLNGRWGLLIVDEVHLMPGDMFRIVASLQSCKRLALTASFVREDGREKEILSLIGPIRFNKPWKDLEAQGDIGKVNLREVRVPMNNSDRRMYEESTNATDKFEIASKASSKLSVIKQLLEKHKNDKVLILGVYTDYLQMLSNELNIPFVYGKTTHKEREKYYDLMRNDDINFLIASKIATTALDIPKINVVIQVNIQYGSRSSEAQAAGRTSRPKLVESYFYTIISKDTKEEDYNFNRQKFLTDEGYRYEIVEMA